MNKDLRDGITGILLTLSHPSPGIPLNRVFTPGGQEGLPDHMSTVASGRGVQGVLGCDREAI